MSHVFPTRVATTYCHAPLPTGCVFVGTIWTLARIVRCTGATFGPVGFLTCEVALTVHTAVARSSVPDQVTEPGWKAVVVAGNIVGSSGLFAGFSSAAIALFTPASASEYATWSALERAAEPA